MLDMPIHEERELPKFSLRQIDMPDVREWEVGDQKYLIMKVEMVSKRSMKGLPEREDRAKVEGDFQVMNIRALGDEPVDAKTLASEDFERTVAKAKSGRA